MKIIYVANVRMPTEKAHGVQIAKTCEALTVLGHDVELVVPDRKTDILDDLFSYYALTARFSLKRLPVWDTVRYGTIGFLFESFLFARAVRRYIRDISFDLLLSRDEHVLAHVPAPYIWESHTGAWNGAAQKVARRAKCVVVISEGLKNFYRSQGVAMDKFVVAHDGVDLEQFARQESKEKARKRLKLPKDSKIAMYIGRLDGWKGINTLLEASKFLPRGWVLAIIGGETAQIARFSLQYPHVQFLGFHPYRELPDNMAAADVLVLPNTGRDEVSAKFTSPLKLFAYMTSGVPIVASDLPSIREVVDEHSAFLVQPDDPAALAKGIESALKEGDVRAFHARSRVAAYSWKKRAERIVAACAAD